MIYKPKSRVTNDVLKLLVSLKDEIEPEEATINMGKGQLVDDQGIPEHRRTEIRWVLPETFPEIFQFAQSVADEFGHHLLALEKVVVEPAIQFTTYYPGHFYGWHIDDNPQVPGARVLSSTILLTDKFTGGRLEFKRPGAPKLKRAGDFVLFDADEEHRVQPVRTGIRDSLVVWWRRPDGRAAGSR